MKFRITLFVAPCTIYTCAEVHINGKNIAYLGCDSSVLQFSQRGYAYAHTEEINTQTHGSCFAIISPNRVKLYIK